MFTRFVLVLLITITMIVLYNAIRPYSMNQMVNYQSIPKVFPKLSRVDNLNCDVLTSCDNDGSCDTCGAADDTDSGALYTCTTVTADSNVEYKGQKVPPGRWCLPSGLGTQNCGTHTGKYVWSRYKGWHCTCLYPNLFGGRDCMTQLACRVPGLKDHQGVLVDQSTNVLKSKSGHVWDPTKEGFNPYGRTPYDSNPDGSPYYTCSCDSTKVGVKFVKLKGDPYRCHKDPCTPQGQIPFYNPETNSCDCHKHQVGQYVRSNVTQRCVKTNCNYNYKTGQCMCPEGLVSLTCNSRTMTRTNPEDGECPVIPAGVRCKDPCKGYCTAGAIPTLDTTNKRCTCKCRKSNTLKFSGDRCEKYCIKDGVKSDEYSMSKCCGRSRPLWGGGSKCVSDSCFVGDALVTMADGSQRRVDMVTKGDLVRSASGTTTTVLFVDQVLLEDRYLVGLGLGTTPFVTEDHCFYGPSGQRLAFNPSLSQQQKHWSSVQDLAEVYPDVVACKGRYHTPVYDIITSDHTLVVNDIPFYDEMPEVDLHPDIAVVIFLILSKVPTPVVADTTAERHMLADRYYSLYSQDAIARHTQVTFEDCYATFFEADSSIIRMAATMWERLFHKIRFQLLLG